MAYTKKFSGKLAFLSNMHVLTNPIEFDGVEYYTVEHAYQVARTLDLEWREKIAACGTPYAAKTLAKQAPTRPNWLVIRVGLMDDLVQQKFRNNPDLMELICSIPDEDIVEENSWGDTFWGVCNGVGTDWLGYILRNIKHSNYDDAPEDELTITVA